MTAIQTEVILGVFYMPSEAVRKIMWRVLKALWRAAGGRSDCLVEGNIHKALTMKGPNQMNAFMLQ